METRIFVTKKEDMRLCTTLARNIRYMRRSGMLEVEIETSSQIRDDVSNFYTLVIPPPFMLQTFVRIDEQDEAYHFEFARLDAL